MCTFLGVCKALGWNRFITNRGYKILCLCNENVCHSISFYRNSDKLWYVSSHLKILRKAPVMRGKLYIYIYTMTKYQRFELLIFANWKNQRLRRGNEGCSSLTERGATNPGGRWFEIARATSYQGLDLWEGILAWEEKSSGRPRSITNFLSFS